MLEVSLPANRSFAMTLYVRRTSIPGKGSLTVRRQQMDDTLGKVIEKALTKKLPKLINTQADRRLLILERQHMNLFPNRILEEIEAKRTDFPALGSVDEIWILETMFYDREGYLRFELFRHGRLAASIDFIHGQLFDKFENGTVVLGSAAKRT